MQTAPRDATNAPHPALHLYHAIIGSRSTRAGTGNRRIFVLGLIGWHGDCGVLEQIGEFKNERVESRGRLPVAMRRF